MIRIANVVSAASRRKIRRAYFRSRITTDASVVDVLPSEMVVKAMDAGGHLYVAAHNSNRQPPRSEVVVLNPRGEVVATMRAPEGVRASNVGFGRGKDSSSLYVTNLFTWRLFRIKTEQRGHYFE
jgi:sugar lactone lactonase YvrE